MPSTTAPEHLARAIKPLGISVMAHATVKAETAPHMTSKLDMVTVDQDRVLPRAPKATCVRNLLGDLASEYGKNRAT
jgi:hypothetical protein